MHSISANHHTICSSNLKSFCVLYHNICKLKPFSSVLESFYLSKINWVHKKLGRMKSSKTFLYFTIYSLIIQSWRFPAHSSEKSKSFHDLRFRSYTLYFNQCSSWKSSDCDSRSCWFMRKISCIYLIYCSKILDICKKDCSFTNSFKRNSDFIAYSRNIEAYLLCLRFQSSCKFHRLWIKSNLSWKIHSISDYFIRTVGSNCLWIIHNILYE